MHELSFYHVRTGNCQFTCTALYVCTTMNHSTVYPLHTYTYTYIHTYVHTYTSYVYIHNWWPVMRCVVNSSSSLLTVYVENTRSDTADLHKGWCAAVPGHSNAVLVCCLLVCTGVSLVQPTGDSPGSGEGLATAPHQCWHQDSAAHCQHQAGCTQRYSTCTDARSGFYLGMGFGGEMVRGKYTLGSGLGFPPPGKC